MKKSIQLYSLGILLLFLGQWAFGQEGRVYVSNNPNGQGTVVRWVGPEISYQEGVKIYRKTGRKDWELLTPSPIMPPTSVPSDLGLSQNEQGIMEGFLGTDHAEFLESLGSIFTLIETIKSLPLAKAMRIAYEDKTATYAKKYTYKVEAELKGKTILLGTTEEIRCEKYQPVEAPQNITIERKRKNVNIWWDNDEAVYYSYNVYLKRPENEEFKLAFEEIGAGNLGDAKKNFLDFKTHKDSTYFIKIQARDYFGQFSEMSEEIEVGIQDLDPPVVPELVVKSNAKDGTIRISWPAITEPDLKNYNLYRMHEGADSFYTQINRKPIKKQDTLYIDQPKEAGSYAYRLEAVDEAGNAAKSYAQGVELPDIIPPAIPIKVYIKPDTGIFKLKWTPNSEGDLRGYIVMRSVADENNSDNTWMPASAVIDTNYYEEPIPENVRSPFAYCIQSVDTLLNKSELSEVVIGQLPDVVPPVAPYIRSVNEEEGQMRIEWVENVEKDLKGYHIYRKIKGDTLGFQQLNGAMVPKSIAAYTDKTAERGSFYEYYVVAFDMSDLRSPNSNIAGGKREHLPLTGEVAITKSKFNSTKKEIILAWNTDQLINEPVVGCAIFRSIDGSRPLQRGKVTQKVEFKEKVADSGQYEYHVRVYGKRGNILKSEPVQIEVKSE